jgi:uncharacterized protein (DUF885 family)
MRTTHWMLGVGCVFFFLATATAQADTLDRVVAAYEGLAAQTDAEAGSAWPDVTPTAAAARTSAYKELKARLGRLPRPKAGTEQALTRQLLDWRLDMLIEGAAFDEDRVPFDVGDGFFNTANYAAANTVLHDVAEARRFIERLAALPGYYAAQKENMRRGIRTGFVSPRRTAEGILDVLRIQAGQPASASPLLAPFSHMPSTVNPQQIAVLRADAERAIETIVKPMQTDMVRFFESEYIPAARTALGVRTVPQGEAYYAFLVRRSTTLALTPDEVYALGEAEVARLKGEMREAMRAAGFEGSLPEFIEKLRHEPVFYAPNLETYVEKASEIGKRSDALLPRYFGQLPRLTWGIKKKPPELEASSSGYDPGDPARGISGSVVVGSTSYIDPLFGLPAWVLHEGVPGHHLQIALAQERSDLPKFRRRDDITAFVEGWALYAEQLGEEMGIYRDPYERFGRLSFDMWRACRLLMDVGIHWKGWTAEEAEACLRDNTTLPEARVRYETARYIAWPGQALAYKVGELRFLELRRRAESALGEHFDLRAFHDMLLDEGTMPMSVLEMRVIDWIENTRHRGP